MEKPQNAFHAIRFQQGVGTEHGQIMYLTAMPARWLLGRAEVDRWRPDISDEDVDNQGYQRELSSAHISAIVRYLQGTLRNTEAPKALPIFPTSVLLAARSSVDFRPLDSPNEEKPHWVVSGHLVLPSECRLFTIDGQHRIEGLKKAMEEAEPEVQALLGDYHLPVTIMECKDKIQELFHFVTINKEAKSVRTDLAERLLDLVRETNPELIRDENLRRATEGRAVALAIVKELERQKDQPWFGRIAKPNERRSGHRVAGEGQLSKSLRHICGIPPLGWNQQKLTEYVIDFWRVAEALLPDAFEDARNHTIQRAVGFAPLHRILPSLVTCYDGTSQSLRQVLEGVAPYFTDSSYWAKPGESSQYSSEGGYKIHAQKITNAIVEYQQVP